MRLDGKYPLLQKIGLFYVISMSYDGSWGTLVLDIWMTIHRVATEAVTFNCWLNIQDEKSSMLLFRIT